jgi:hypothetical protein
MFSSCFNQEQQYKFNNEQGLNTYFDPFLKLVCVSINNAPDMDYFYVSETMDVETKNAMITKSTENPINKGFTST